MFCSFVLMLIFELVVLDFLCCVVIFGGLKLIVLLCSGVNVILELFFCLMFFVIYKSCLGDLLRRVCIVILEVYGWLLMGVMDEIGFLDYG